MPEPMRVAVIYYSSTGNVARLAEAAAEGAEKIGAHVRLRRVRELAPPEAVNSTPEWAANLERTAEIEEAAVEDLAWADVVLFGTPTRYGNIAAQLEQFIDTTGPLWLSGALADKVYGAFVSTLTAHGGQETTLLAFATLFHHWGGIIVPPGFTDPIQLQLGNPYGTSHVFGNGPPGEVELEAARYQARRAVETAAALKAGRAA